MWISAFITSSMFWTRSRSNNIADVVYGARYRSAIERTTVNRGSPGSNPLCYHFEVWPFSFYPRHPSPLSCVNVYLAIDSGGNMSEYYSCSNCCMIEYFPEKSSSCWGEQIYQGVKCKTCERSNGRILRYIHTNLDLFLTFPLSLLQMSSVSSRGPSPATENDLRMRNNRTTTTNQQQTTPPSSPEHSSERGSKACCFCWCCCCSCSW